MQCFFSFFQRISKNTENSIFNTLRGFHSLFTATFTSFLFLCCHIVVEEVTQFEDLKAKYKYAYEHLEKNPDFAIVILSKVVSGANWKNQGNSILI